MHHNIKEQHHLCVSLASFQSAVTYILLSAWCEVGGMLGRVSSGVRVWRRSCVLWPHQSRAEVAAEQVLWTQLGFPPKLCCCMCRVLNIHRWHFCRLFNKIDLEENEKILYK